MDVKSKFTIVPENFSGTRRAVIIGINYVGQQGELSGCHNDAKNMIEYIKDVHGFEDEDVSRARIILVLAFSFVPAILYYD